MEVERPADRGARRAPFAVLALVWVALLVLLGALGALAGDVGDCRDLNIVELELAFTADRAQDLLDGCPDLEPLRDGLRADSLLFVPAYVVVLAFWPVVAQLQRGQAAGRVRRDRLAVGAVLVAGVLDLIENQALHQVLDDAGDGTWPAVAAAAAVPKFLLVLVAAVLGLGALRDAWRGRDGRAADAGTGGDG